MRQTPFFYVALLLLVWAVAAAEAESGVSGWIEPEVSGRLEPCCDNTSNALPPLRKFVGQRMPDHSFLPPEELARRKAAAFANPDLPQGKKLVEVDGKPNLPVVKGRAGTPLLKALTVRTEFEGLNIAQAGFSFPPDTIVAASPTRVLEATNVALRLSLRGGGSAQRRSLDNFFGVPTEEGFHFDPKVFFDRLTSRFYVIDVFADFVNRKSFIYLAVSRSATPTDLLSPDNWCTYRLNARVGQSWADYPGLGMNEKWLSVSVNNFAFVGPFRAVFIYALDKQRLARNSASCPSVDFFRYKAAQDGNGQIAFTVQPAQHYSTNSLEGTPLFFVSTDLTLQVTRDYTLWRLVDRPPGKPGLLRHGLAGSQRYTFAPNAPQLNGTPLDTGDPRAQHAVYRDGVVWTVHGTGCNFGFTPGESCVRVVGITPTDSGGSVTFEDIYGGGDDWFVWMPGVAVNGAGDVALAFQRSRSNMSAGVAFAGKPAASASFESLTKLINGRCSLDNFDGRVNRTGDYVGIQTDPADDLSFWIAGEYTGNVGRLGCNWRSRVARIGF